MHISRVFVYGTLLSGMSNHERFCGDALTIEPAVTTGRLYHLPYGFPAMFDAPDGQVFGEVLTFPNIMTTLERIDRLEGYRSINNCHYLRLSKRLTILNKNGNVHAWVYVYPQNRLEEVQRIGTIITHGCWRNFVAAKDEPYRVP